MQQPYKNETLKSFKERNKDISGIETEKIYFNFLKSNKTKEDVLK